VSKNRFSARTDDNEKHIVKALRKLGYQVETGHDDILVAANNRNYWYEIKQKKHVSKKTGLINESAKKPSQIRLEKEWKGHYKIVSSLDEVLKEIKII
jgi:hypothetical protein